MRKSVLVKYYNQRRAEDIERFKTHGEHITEHSNKANRYLYWEAFRQGGLPMTNPLPSTLLIKKLFERTIYAQEDAQIAYGSQVATSAVQRRNDIGEFLTRYALPVAGIAVDKPAVTMQVASSDAGSCLMVEKNFGLLLEQVAKRDVHHPHVTVYFDQPTLQPVLLRKTHDNSSAIVLRPISAGGVYVPTGAVVGFPYERNHEHGTIEGQYALAGKANRGAATYAAYAMEPGAEIEPVRLTPWAFDEPADRALFALDAFSVPGGGYEVDGFSRSRVALLERTSIADFQEAAAKVMQITGVTT